MVRPLEITLLNSHTLLIDSKSLSITHLRDSAHRYYAKGGRTVIISGGENVQISDFYEICSACARIPSLFISYRGCKMQIYTDVYYVRWLPGAPCSPFRGEVLDIEIEDNQIFVGRKIDDENAQILNQGRCIELSMLETELNTLTKNGSVY